MEIEFEKYQGTGNDFIVLDGISRPAYAQLDATMIAQLCHRRFGIGADGLIILQQASDIDFNMLYYNADGYPGSMCGNGGRCAVSFAYRHGYTGQQSHFQASDGPHEAVVLSTSDDVALIRLSLTVSADLITIDNDEYFIDTGSPHHVRVVHNLSQVNALHEGKAIRYSDRYKEAGVNVNFVELSKEFIKLNTYERGVEDLTYSCGTGVTAAAIVANHIADYAWPVKVLTTGGTLQVDYVEGKYFLTGQVCRSFTGKTRL